MRKCYILILSLVSLLLTGCLGTSSKYVYDGSPTALEVVINQAGLTVRLFPILVAEVYRSQRGRWGHRGQ